VLAATSSKVGYEILHRAREGHRALPRSVRETGAHR